MQTGEKLDESPKKGKMSYTEKVDLAYSAISVVKNHEQNEGGSCKGKI